MELVRFQYSEFLDGPRKWVLEPVEFDAVKLIVGMNATGKSRTLNTIAGLARIVSGQDQRTFLSGRYTATFHWPKKKPSQCVYELEYRDNQVVLEHFVHGPRSLLKRGPDGSTTIRFEGLRRSIKYQMAPNQVAAFTRRDERQHPFLQDLYDWGTSVRHIEFGKSLGRELLIVPNSSAAGGRAIGKEMPKTIEVSRLYRIGRDRYKKRFDAAILKDMADFGYPCTAIGLTALNRNEFTGSPIPPECLFVQEKGLSCKTRQLEISEGMFRALALSINLNFSLFSKSKAVFLIDDIGEGLDFERSKSIIQNLIKKSQASGIRIVMTTNNRFVMNGAPLEYWSVLEREGHLVKEYSMRSAPKRFEEFKFSGLNNFDFFAGAFFKSTKGKSKRGT